MDALCAAVGQMVYQAAHAWKAKGRVAAGTRDENAVNLSRPHEGLLKQLPLRVLAAVKQPVALALAQRHRRRRPVASAHIQSSINRTVNPDTGLPGASKHIQFGRSG